MHRAAQHVVTAERLYIELSSVSIVTTAGVPGARAESEAAVSAVSGTGVGFDCDLSFALLRLTPLTAPGTSVTAPDENVTDPKRRPGRIDLRRNRSILRIQENDADNHAGPIEHIRSAGRNPTTFKLDICCYPIIG